MRFSPGVIIVSTYYLTIIVLNLGLIDRMPHFAGVKRYPREIRNDKTALEKNWYFRILFCMNNPGHIVTLCESYDFMQFSDWCEECSIIGLQCRSDKTEFPSPAIAVFLKSPYVMVEFTVLFIFIVTTTSVPTTVSRLVRIRRTLLTDNTVVHFEFGS